MGSKHILHQYINTRTVPCGIVCRLGGVFYLLGGSLQSGEMGGRRLVRNNVRFQTGDAGVALSMGLGAFDLQALLLGEPLLVEV